MVNINVLVVVLDFVYYCIRDSCEAPESLKIPLFPIIAWYNRSYFAINRSLSPSRSRISQPSKGSGLTYEWAHLFVSEAYRSGGGQVSRSLVERGRDGGRSNVETKATCTAEIAPRLWLTLWWVDPKNLAYIMDISSATVFEEVKRTR